MTGVPPGVTPRHAVPLRQGQWSSSKVGVWKELMGDLPPRLTSEQKPARNTSESVRLS